MYENELELSRKTVNNLNIRRIEELERWFRFEYPSRLNTIERYRYLGLPLPETRWSLEHEAYDRENELRQLKGLSPLPELKYKDIL